MLTSGRKIEKSRIRGTLFLCTTTPRTSVSVLNPDGIDGRMRILSLLTVATAVGVAAGDAVGNDGNDGEGGHDGEDGSDVLSDFVRARGWKEVTLLAPSACDGRARRLAATLRRRALRNLKVNCLDVAAVAAGAAAGSLAAVRENISEYFDVLGVLKPHSLLVLLEGRGLDGAELDALRSVRVTSAFFLMEFWNDWRAAPSLVHTFKFEEDVVVMPASLSRPGLPAPALKVSYDLQGARLRCNAIDFWPYHAVGECADGHRDCDLFGPYADVWHLMEKRYNFTTQVRIHEMYMQHDHQKNPEFFFSSKIKHKPI